MREDGELVVADLRPFFTRALEEGYRSKLLKISVFERIKRDGVEMTLGFAERYYTKFYEAYLLQAMHSIIGVLSLGLYEFSKGDLGQAIKVIGREALVDIFRVGWTKVTKVRDLVRSSGRFLDFGTDQYNIAIVERDIAELISSSPQGNWTGWQEYEELLQHYSNAAQQKQYHRWLRKSFFRAESHLDGPDYDQRAEAITPYYLSLAISPKPFSPLQYEHIIQIAGVLTTEQEIDSFKKRLHQFIRALPSRWQNIARREVNEFLRDEASSIIRLIKENRMGDLANFIVTNYLGEVETSVYVEALYDSYRENVKGKPVGYLLRMLRGEEGTAIDASLRLAIVDELLSRARISPRTVSVILARSDRSDWLGKINWQKFTGAQLLEILTNEESIHFQEDTLGEIFQRKINAPRQWWQSLPIDLIDLAFQTLPPVRSLLLQNVRVPWSAIEKKAETVGLLPHYAFLLEPNDWLEVWSRGLGETLLLPLINDARRLMAWPRAEAVKNLLTVCETLIGRYRAEMESGLLVKPPFYVFGLEEVVREILQPDEFEIFKKHLAS